MIDTATIPERRDPAALGTHHHETAAPDGAGQPEPELAPAALGGFRLCHYVGFVAIVFVLGIVLVWQQVSLVRLGYLIEEADSKHERALASYQSERSDFDRELNLLALSTMVKEMELSLSPGSVAQVSR